jgi:hypothetical protein
MVTRVNNRAMTNGDGRNLLKTNSTVRVRDILYYLFQKAMACPFYFRKE